jgi:predicted nuclease with RNAse H fold
MLTVGIDLAAEPKNTAIASIEWSAEGARVLDVHTKVTDDEIVKAAKTATKIGIDCPLGWPDEFVLFLRGFHEGTYDAIPRGADKDWRRTLANRLTDLEIHKTLKMTPLSVSTDRIGHAAMRAAHVQARLSEAGYPVDRIGDGLLVEVYPAAGLRFWQMDHRQYKGTKYQEALGKLVSTLPGWLDLGEHEKKCRESDHAFDALISALLARASVLGLTRPPSADQRAVAAREGWIAMPTCPIDALI